MIEATAVLAPLADTEHFATEGTEVQARSHALGGSAYGIRDNQIKQLLACSIGLKYPKGHKPT